jgi:hypothetical protein
MKTSEDSSLSSEMSTADAELTPVAAASPGRPSTDGGPPRAQTRAMRTGDTAGRPITVVMTDDESNDEDPDENLEGSLQQDEGSQGTAEATSLLELGAGGQQYFDWEHHCLVRLGQKASGWTLPTLRTS